jgi:hypothetical protein
MELQEEHILFAPILPKSSNSDTFIFRYMDVI